MVNLAPGATDYGALYGLSGTTQFGMFNGEASLWQGTPGSRVSLHPSGAPANSGPSPAKPAASPPGALVARGSQISTLVP